MRKKAFEAVFFCVRDLNCCVLSVCAKRNFIDAEHHIVAKHIICTRRNIVYLCRERQ